MKNLSTFLLLFSMSLNAQESASLKENSDRQVLFYNAEVSRILTKSVSEREYLRQRTRDQIKSTAEIIGGSGAIIVSRKYFAGKYLGDALLVGGGLAVATGIFSGPTVTTHVRADIQQRLQKTEAFAGLSRQLYDRHIASASVLTAVDTIITSLMDDIINGLNLGISAKKRCEKFAKTWQTIRKPNEPDFSAEECEQIVLESLAAHTEITRRHAPPPAAGAHAEARPAP